MSSGTAAFRGEVLGHLLTERLRGDPPRGPRAFFGDRELPIRGEPCLLDIGKVTLVIATPFEEGFPAPVYERAELAVQRDGPDVETFGRARALGLLPARRARARLARRMGGDVSPAGSSGSPIVTERKKHVRRSRPPWRRGTPVSECGLDVADAEMITRDDAHNREPTTVCQTCFATMMRHRTWEDHPAAHMVREAGGQFAGIGSSCGPLDDELRVLGDLVNLHREEYDEMLNVYRLRRRLAE